jgi:hypothetical protein
MVDPWTNKFETGKEIEEKFMDYVPSVHGFENYIR